jgi:outer membrane protein OmpA-like peptidoglycan-associated protein
MKRSWLAIATVAAGAAGRASAEARECHEAAAEERVMRGDELVPTARSTIYFARGSWRIPPAARDTIEQLADWLVDHPERLLFVEGHADRTGTWTTNLQLSQERAEQVRAALVRAGADPYRIVVTAYSEDRALDASARCSRRVVVHGSAEGVFEATATAQRERTAPRERAPAATDRDANRAARPAPRR